MGKTRSTIIGLALVLGQTVAAHAADLGYTTPLPEPCVGCGGPWYLKGYIGMATPDVGDIWAEEYQFNDFTIFHKDIKSTPLLRARRCSASVSATTQATISASTSPANIAASPCLLPRTNIPVATGSTS